MLRNLFIGVLFCLFAASTNAQESQFSVAGTVSSAEGELIPMAMITISDEGIRVFSDVDGKFSISGLKAGKYKIFVTAMGFRPGEKVIEVHEQKTLIIEVRLEEVVGEMNEVVILHKELKDFGFSSETATTENLRNQTIDLNKILDQTSGTRVRQDGGLGSRVSYTMNGLGGKAVRFFLDGIPMDYYGSSFSVNTIPISMIEKVEVYKGVIPIQFSSDALGGAVNLVTKNSRKSFAELSYSYGSFNTHRASVNAQYHDDTTGFTTRAAAFYNHSDNNYFVWGDKIYATDLSTYEVKRGIKVRRFHDAFSSKSVKADVGFTNQKWADQVFVGLLYSGSDKELQHGSTMEAPYGEATYMQRVIAPYLIYRQYNILKHIDLNFFSTYSDLERKQVDTSSNIYNWFGAVEGKRTLGGERSRTLNQLNEKAFLSRLNMVYTFTPHHKIGFNAILTHLNRTDRDPLLTQKTEGYWSPQNFKKLTMGLAYEGSFSDGRINTSVFLKSFSYGATVKTSEINKGVTSYYDVKTQSFQLGYGFAAELKATSFLSFNASVEKACRLPESEEILGDGIIIKSTSTLNPESSDNVNLGFKLHLFEKKKNQIYINGNVFYRNVKDLIQQSEYDPGAFVYINFDKVQMKGFDAKLQYQYKNKFTFTETVSFLHPLLKSKKDSHGNVNILHNSRLPNIPFFQNGADFRYHLKNVVLLHSETFFYWNINYVGSFYRKSEILGNYGKEWIPEQLIHSAGIGYTFPSRTLSIGVDLNNIFNEQAYDNFAIQKPGRAIYAKVTYRII